MRTIRNYIRETLIKFLKKHEGEKVVMSDLMPTLFTRLSKKQLATFELYIQDIFENFDDYGSSYCINKSLYQYSKVAFYLTILSVESTYILYRNDFIFDNWDNEIILTKELIENIKSSWQTINDGII